MRGAALPLLLLALQVLGAVSTSRAYDRKAAKAYERGLDEAKSANWAAARAAFEEAIGLDDNEGRVRISGVKYADYYPSLGLAEAALELGDREAARSALARFDSIKKPGSEQESRAAALRERLEDGAASSAVTTPPPRAAGPTAEAQAAKRALDEGDLAGARRLARGTPTDELAQEVLTAVDALLAGKLTAARRDQEAGALAAAETKLSQVLSADPGNSAATSLLAAVRADVASARSRLQDASAALAAGRFDDAERLARQARTRDASLGEEARALELRISEGRRAGVPGPANRRADAGRQLGQARSALDAGRLAEARRLAGDALAADAGKAAEAEAVRSEIARRQGEADDALRRARSAVNGGRFGDARQLVSEAQRLDRGLEADAARVRAEAGEGEVKARGLLAKIEAHLESGAAASARTVLDELARDFPEHPELAAQRAGVEGSGELVAGLRAYFRGDWESSIELLTPLLGADEQRGDLLSVLGCAHATRGLLEGARPDLQRARELFVRALAANPGLELDPRYFSPRLRALFDQARGT